MQTIFAIETSHASMAWEFISKALNICQTLGLHCKYRTGKLETAALIMSTSLFWKVYKVERSMALRLGRSSNIQDSDITVSTHSAMAKKHLLAGCSAGEVHRLLYSPQGLSRNPHERYETVVRQAENLRAHIQDQEQSIKVPPAYMNPSLHL